MLFTVYLHVGPRPRQKYYVAILLDRYDDSRFNLYNLSDHRLNLFRKNGIYSSGLRVCRLWRASPIQAPRATSSNLPLQLLFTSTAMASKRGHDDAIPMYDNVDVDMVVKVLQQTAFSPLSLIAT